MNESILVRIDSDPLARLWNGLGDLIIAADYVEPETSIYLGGGALLKAPDFQSLISGTAERLTLTVSGVNAETLRLALEEADSVEGARVDIGTIRFDSDYQPLGSVTWEKRLRADTLSVNDAPGESGRERTISLSISTEETGRSRAPIAFFTAADQQRRSPDDQIFNRVAGISGGTSRRFGPI